MEEAIALANSTSYGLAAGCVTDNINTALTVANSLQGGSVWQVVLKHILSCENT